MKNASQPLSSTAPDSLAALPGGGAGFWRGMADALPIFAGYAGVGFAFGMLAIRCGHPWWAPPLTSVTHVSGTGQFALVNVLAAGGGAWEVLLALVMLNVRYVLMALAVAQRLAPGIGTARRLLMAMGDTDEIVGVALGKGAPIGFRYWMGLTVCSMIGWVGGSALAASPWLGEVLPQALLRGLGMALYAMFAAILLPMVRHDRRARMAVLIAAALSVGLRIITRGTGGSWILLVSGTIGALYAAWRVPAEVPADGDVSEREGDAT